VVDVADVTTGRRSETAAAAAAPTAGPWREAAPELAIAAVAVVATALAGGAVAGWPGLAVVAIGAASISLVVLRGLLPRSAAQSFRRARDKQVARPIFGYAQRRFVVAGSMANRPVYEADLRPLLEHLLAARLAEKHGINLYTDQGAARRAFCRTRGDEALWRWVDPAQTLSPAERDKTRRGISPRTLTRLVNRLEQL
jgi:hypothetical protein